MRRGESRAVVRPARARAGQHEFEVYALSRSARQEAAGWLELPGNVAGCAPRRCGARADRAGAWDGREGSLRAARTAAFREHFGPGRGHLPVGRTAGRAGGGDADLAADRRASAAPTAPPAGGPFRRRSVRARRTRPRTRRAGRARSAPKTPYASWSPPAARPAHCAPRTPRRSPICSPSPSALERALRPLSLDWYGDRDGDLGLSASTCATPRPAARPPCPGCWPSASSASRCWSPSTASGCASTTWRARRAPSRRPSRARPYAPCSPPSRAGSPPRPTPGRADHPRQHPRPPLAGALRRRPRQAAHGLPGHGRRPASPRSARGGRRPPTAERAGVPTLVWVGRIEPAKDLIALLHAFAEVRKAAGGRGCGIIATARPRRAGRRRGRRYLAHCRALAAQLFPDEATDAHTVGDNPVSFEEIGSPEVPTLAGRLRGGCRRRAVQRRRGLPRLPGRGDVLRAGHGLHGRRRGRARSSAARGWSCPPRNPRALAEACAALLRDPERAGPPGRRGPRAGAGAVHRRAERRGIPRHLPGADVALPRRRPESGGERGAAPGDGTLPFARPAESHVPGRWASAAPAARATAGAAPGTGQPPPSAPPGTLLPDDDAPHVRRAGRGRRGRGRTEREERGAADDPGCR